MAAPWEDSVVMALRDTQWMEGDGTQSARPSLPSLFIKMDGETEKALGDVILKNGESFYLIEAKSSANGIATEWNKRDANGGAKPKAAFTSLSNLMNHLKLTPETYEDAYRLSLACHHFVYWSDDVFDLNDTFANIMVEPYILACNSRRTSPMPKRAESDVYELGELVENGEMLTSAALPFSVIRKQSGYVMRRNPVDTADDGTVIAQFGAGKVAFLEYLWFLLQEGGGGDGILNAVILSDQGTFVRNIKSIAQLRAELERPSATSDSAAKPTPVRVEREVRRPKFSTQKLAPKPTFPPPGSDPKPSSTRKPKF